jgi:hypothetical protein
VQAQDAASLRARYSAQAKQLIATPFRRPLHLESSESSGASQGDLYAVIARPFGVAGPALQGLDHWCDILILHLNVKQCRQSAADTLRVNIGRKFDQPLGDAYLFQFVYQVVAVKDDYLQVLLTAAHGPLGTSGYRILLEVVALDPTRSFLHLSYAYSAGPVANAAAQVYLATIGRKKVGFSVTGSKDDGEPIYIRGTRGVVERNAMRCYVAIEAYLGSLSLPASEQIEKRLNDWYAGIERYPVQLHEMDRTAYLDMKHKEVARQQLPQGAG